MLNRGMLVDTNILSQTMKVRPDPAILDWLFMGPKLIISHPVIYEIEWGARKQMRADPERAAKILAWLDDLIDKAKYDIPPPTAALTRLQARMSEVPELSHLGTPRFGKRRRPPGQDVAIAAYAITYNLPIATLDTQDFALIHRHFPLPGLFDPSIRWWAVPSSASARVRRTLATAEDRYEPHYELHRYACVY